MDRYPITKEGYDTLGLELKDLINKQRPQIVQAISEAREHGDLSENAEYHAAKEKQGMIEGRINDLQAKYNKAQIIDTKKTDHEHITFGATVTLFVMDSEEEKTIQIVGEYEANADIGKISLKAPLARALIGKEEGDEITANVPMGKKHYEVIKVEYK